MQTPCKKSTIFTVCTRLCTRICTRIYAVFPVTTPIPLPYHHDGLTYTKKRTLALFLWTCDGFYLVAYLSFRMKLPPTAIFCLIVGLPL